MSAVASRVQGAVLQVRSVIDPIDGESADGVLGRVAAAECAARTLDFTSIAGASSAGNAALSRQGPDGVRLVAKVIGADPDDLMQRCTVETAGTGDISFFGLTIDRQHVVSRVRRYAPASLVASEHHRALWMLKPFPFCEETWQFLVERCPSVHCDAVQRWRWTNGIGICDRCGELLARGDADSVPEALRDPLRLAVGLVHPDPARRAESRALLPDDFAEADGGAVLDLLSAVAGAVDPAIRYGPSLRIVDPHAAPDAVAAAVAAAWTILSDWPAAFERLAGERLAARPGRFGDGNEGATLALLHLPRRTRMRPAAAELLVRLSERLMTNGDQGYPTAEAAALVGVSASAISDMRRRGDVPTIFHLGSTKDRVRPLLEKAAIDAMSRRPMIQHSWAATRLGTSYRAIDVLVARHALERVGRAGSSDDARVTSASFDALVARLAAASARLDGDLIPLRSAMRIVGGRFKPWAEALLALLDGRIAFDFAPAAPSAAEGIRIDRESARMLLELPEISDPAVPHRPMLTKRDAVECLNLHGREVTGVLGPWEGSHGTDASVPSADLLAIARRHVAPAEAAMRLSIAPSAVRRFMSLHGIRKLSAAGYDRAAFEAALANL